MAPATLEALVQYSAEQGLIASPVPVEKLFVGHSFFYSVRGESIEPCETFVRRLQGAIDRSRHEAAIVGEEPTTHA
jgi:hypothetical protein